MNEWEARYKALLAGITNPDIVMNAENLVRIAADISGTSCVPFKQTFYALLYATGLLQHKEAVNE